MPFVALLVESGVGGGCFWPGSLLEALEGEGEVCGGLFPLTDV